MLELLSQSTWTDRLGWTLVHSLWQFALLALLALVVQRTLRPRTAVTRYWALLLFLAATVAAPVATWFSPWSINASTNGSADSPAMAARLAPTEEPQDAPPLRQASLPEHEPVPVAMTPVSAQPPVELASQPEPPPPEPAAIDLAAAWSIVKSHVQPWLREIVLVWLVGVLLTALRPVLGWYTVRRLRVVGVSPVTDAIRDLLARTAKRLELHRAVDVLQSTLVKTPVVVGYFRPAVLLPLSVVSGMPAMQLEAILAHELAHIRRHDYLVNLFQTLVETLFFYHPAVWWLSRQIRNERENCCDDVAMSAVDSRSDYGRALLALEELRAVSPALSLAARGGLFLARIRRIAGCEPSPRIAGGGILGVIVVLLALVAALTWAAAPEAEKLEQTAATAQTFSTLSDAEQRATLVKAFQQRLEQGTNLFFETEQVYRAFKSDSWQPGKPVTQYPSYIRYRYRYWQLGDSYRTETREYDDPNSVDTCRYSANADNAQEGVGRNVTISKGQNPASQGQVVYPHARSINQRFAFVPSPDDLSATSGNPQYFFQYLIAKKNSYEIKSSDTGDKVQLIIPWHNTKQVFLLDPQKDFLPIRHTTRWDLPRTNGREAHWSETQFEVQESRLCDKVWMPVKMVSKSLSSQNILTVVETNVLRMESGNVKPNDLLVPFPEGMQVADIIEGVTYTADAQGNAVDVKDSQNWKHDPPKGWHRGRVEEAYSMVSKISAAERKRLAEEREAKWKPIDEGLKVLRAHPPAAQEERIEAALEILRVYRPGEREDDWAVAIRELVTIGKPAVPRLIEELDRTDRDATLRATGFVLRGIGDPRAVPALIRAIPRLIQPPSSDFGLTIKKDPDLLKFMWMNDRDHVGNDKGIRKTSGLVLFSYGRPIREIMPALEKLTGQSFGWQELGSAEMKADGTVQLRRQRTLFTDHANKWVDWWSHNWKSFVPKEADAQLDRTKKSIEEFAALTAKMPQGSAPTEIPCGPLVKLAEGRSYHQFDPYLDLDAGRGVPRPEELLKKSPKDHPSAELLAWAAKNGIDLLRVEIKRPGDSKTYYAYQPVGMKVWKIDNKRLKDLEKELQGSKKLDVPPPWTGLISSVERQEGDIPIEEPATFLFITREGTCGTMQIRSALFHEFVEGSPVMGPAVFEYRYIYRSEPKKSSAKETTAPGQPQSTTPGKEAAALSGKPETTDKPDSATARKPEQASAETIVTGQVVNSEGKPIAGAQVAVMVRPRDSRIYVELANQSTLLASANADGEGRFRLKAPKISSAAHLDAIAVAAADGFNFGGKQIGLDIEQPNVTISLTTEQTIRGQVVDTNNAPVANAEIRVKDIGSDSPEYWIGCLDASSQPPFWPKPVTSDQQGHFALRGVDRNGTLVVRIHDKRFAITDYWIAPSNKVSLAGNTRNRVRFTSSGDVTLLPPPLHICEGQVTYGDTHQPVANARVENLGTHDGPGGAALTDAAGRFHLNLLLRKTFDITVYPPEGEAYLISQKTIAFADGEQPPKIAIALPRGVLLQGKVVEKGSDQPIAGATIQLNEYPRSGYYAPERTISSLIPCPARVATKADGTFAIAAPPGFGLLLVRGPGGEFIRQEVSSADFQIKWGNWTRHHVSAFVPLDLKIDQKPAALNIALRRGATIRGRVAGPDNRPVDDVRIFSRHFLDFNNFGGSPVRVKDGQFELHGLDPEAAVPFYFLDAKNELGATVEISGKSADAGPLVVHLQPCGKAVARFVDREGKPQAKQPSSASLVLSPKRRSMAGGDSPDVWADVEHMGNMDSEHYGRDLRTDDNGKVTFTTLIPGAAYQFGLFDKCHDSDDKVFSVRSAETLQLPDIVVRESGATAQHAVKSGAEMKASASTGEKSPKKPDAAAVKTNGVFVVEGTITSPDGKPLADATVGIYPTTFPGSSFPRTKTDRKGHYSFQIDAPGDYIVAAAADAVVPSWKTVAIDKDRQTVDLQLRQGEPIRVRVVDPQGKPMPNVRVSFVIAASDKNAGLIFLDYERDPKHWRRDTDAEGRWSTNWLPKDQLRLLAKKDGYLTATSLFTPGASETVITLEPGVCVSGRVVDRETGAPVKKFRVSDDWPSNPDSRPASYQSRSVENPNGEYRIWFDTPSKDRGLRIEADGYFPSPVQRLRNDEKQTTWNVELVKGESITGIVRSPAGAPLADVEVALCTAKRGCRLYNGRIDDDSLMVRTKADGRFSLPPQNDRYVLLAAHDLGFALIGDETKPREMTLRPWAKLEGQVILDGKPAARERISLQYAKDPAQLPPPWQQPAARWIVRSFDLSTDRNGRFVWDRALPGQATVSREVRLSKDDWDSPSTVVNSRSVELFSGRTLVVAIKDSDPPVIQEREDNPKPPPSTKPVPRQPRPSPVSQGDAKPIAAARPHSNATAAWKPGQTLDFRVINAKTKEPLPDVKLRIGFWAGGSNPLNESKNQITDAQGRSEIKLPNGQPELVQIYPSKAGFVPLLLNWRSKPAPPAIPKTITVSLEPGTIVGGIIQNEQGKTIPGVTVAVEYCDGSGDNPYQGAFVRYEQVTTDKDGRWRINVMPANMAEDRLQIFLTHPDYISDHPQHNYTPTPVTTRPSCEALREQTAVMVMRKGVTIEGRVTDEAGKPIAGAIICNEYSCYDRDPFKITATTDADGHFHLSGLNHRNNYDTCFFAVKATGYSPVLVEHTDAEKPADIKLKRGQTVQGQVVDGNGKPIEGASIKLDCWMGRPRQFYLKTATDAAGKFRIEDAPSDRTEYDIEKQGFMTARRPLPPSSTGYTITLRSPLRVAGSIVDSETNELLAKCRLTKGWDYEDGRTPQWETSIGYPAKEVINGRYEFEFTQDHGARIRAEADGYLPAVSRLFKPGDTDNGHVTYDFRLKKGHLISGTVLGLNEKALAGAEVFIATQQFNVRDRKAGPPVGEKRRMAKTDEKGRFEFPPEVEPFFLIVLHDEGHVVLTEKQVAVMPQIRIQPWTSRNRTFSAERRPPTHANKSSAADAKHTLSVRVIDPAGKPVEDAVVAAETSFRAEYNYVGPNDPAWTYFRSAVSDSIGMARIADFHERWVVARHVERKLVGVRSISPEQIGGANVVTLTMQPQCEVTGRLTSKGLDAHGRKLTWTNVYVYLEDGMARPMYCASNKGEYHFYLPPGTYKLNAYGTDVQHAWKTITVKPGQEELKVEPMDLPPTGLVVLEGKPAPELRDILAWKNGGPVKLSDLRGKVVILAFSSEWSGPGLRGIMPELLPIYKKYRDQGLAIIEIRFDMGLRIESEAKLAEKLAEVKSPFWKDRDDLPVPIALVLMNRLPFRPADNSESPCPLLEDYQGINFQTAVLIDRQGRVVGRFDPRSNSNDAAASNAVLEKVLQEK